MGSSRFAAQKRCVLGGDRLVRGCQPNRTSQRDEERPEQTGCPSISIHQSKFEEVVKSAEKAAVLVLVY
jgi:hypothetical protein